MCKRSSTAKDYRIVACSNGLEKNVGERQSAFDVYIFPDGAVFKSVREKDIPKLMKALGSKSSDESSLSKNALRNDYVFVCCHSSRDLRCGTTGHQIFNLLSTSPELPSDVQVMKISHIGGHKFAGNVICFPSGIWYGGLGSHNIHELIQALKRKTVLEPNFRGYTGQKNREICTEHTSVIGTFLFRDLDNLEHVVEYRRNDTVLDAVKRKGLDVFSAACDSSMACSTCRVSVISDRESEIAGFEERDALESLLESGSPDDVTNVRLGCQLICSQLKSGAIVTACSLL